MTATDSAEYEALFPYEQEYQLWIAAVEADYRDECVHRNGIVVTEKARFPELTNKDN